MKKIGINELYIQYLHDPSDYDVIVSLNDEITRLITSRVTKEVVYGNKSEVINECYHEIWIAIQSREINAENDGFIKYINTIITNIRRKGEMKVDHYQFISLDEPYGSEEDLLLSDTIASQEISYDEQEIIQKVNQLLTELICLGEITQRDAKWFMLSRFDGLSAIKIALIYEQCTSEKVSNSYISRRISIVEKLFLELYTKQTWDV